MMTNGIMCVSRKSCIGFLLLSIFEFRTSRIRRPQWPRVLRRRPLVCWDCGFESHKGHGCFSVVIVVCCQVSGLCDGSLVQRSPTDCRASLCMITKPRKKTRRLKPHYRAVKIQPRWVVTPRKQTSRIHTEYWRPTVAYPIYLCVCELTLRLPD